MRRLDLKYRPQNFNDVIGQETTVEILRKNMANNDIADAYLLYGAHGSGKTTLSRILAMSILCKAKQIDGNPCGVCVSCQGILNKENLNYREEDGGSKGGIDQIREIIEESKYKALDGALKKIVVFDEAHGISKAGQNALLKELEEGEGTIYIFCTTEPEKVLPTVTSRCLPFEIYKVPLDQILTRLITICKAENIAYEEKALSLLIKSRKGHIRDCLKELDKLSSLGAISVETIEDYLQADVQTVYFEILYDLKKHSDRVLFKVDRLLSKLNAADIYNGLVTAALDVYRKNLGLETDLILIDDQIVRELWSLYQISILEVANFLVEKKYQRVDRTILICDLFSLSEKIRINFAQREVVVEKIQKFSESQISSNSFLPSIEKENDIKNVRISLSENVSLFDKPEDVNISSIVNQEADLKYLDGFKDPFYKQGTSKTFYNPELKAENKKEIKRKGSKIKTSRSKFDELTPAEFTQEVLGGLNLNE